MVAVNTWVGELPAFNNLLIMKVLNLSKTESTEARITGRINKLHRFLASMAAYAVGENVTVRQALQPKKLAEFLTTWGKGQDLTHIKLGAGTIVAASKQKEFVQAQVSYQQEQFDGIVKTEAQETQLAKALVIYEGYVNDCVQRANERLTIAFPNAKVRTLVLTEATKTVKLAMAV